MTTAAIRLTISGAMILLLALVDIHVGVAQPRVFQPGLGRQTPGQQRARDIPQDLMAAPMLAAALRGIDPDATVEWDGRVLRVEAAQHKFSLFLTGSEVVIDGSVEHTVAPLHYDGREVFVPTATADRILEVANSGKGRVPPSRHAERTNTPRAIEQDTRPTARPVKERAEPAASSARALGREEKSGWRERVRNWPRGAWVVIAVTVLLLLGLVTGPVKLIRTLWTALAYIGGLILLIPPIPQISRWFSNQLWHIRNRFRIKASLKRHQRLEAATVTQLDGLYRIADLNELAARAFVDAHHGGDPDPNELYEAVLRTFREAEAEVLRNRHLTRSEKREQIARLKAHIDEIFTSRVD